MATQGRQRVLQHDCYNLHGYLRLTVTTITRTAMA